MYIYIYKNEENDDESGSVRPELKFGKLFRTIPVSESLFFKKIESGTGIFL